VIGLRRLYTQLRTKDDFLSWIATAEFDVLVSNGCPYKVPAKYLGGQRLFINIHPSYLPDLRGPHPLMGSLLTGQDSGATCHAMDASINTGDIIAQVKIPHTSELDAPFLQQLSMMAERECSSSRSSASSSVSGRNPRKKIWSAIKNWPRTSSSIGASPPWAS